MCIFVLPLNRIHNLTSLTTMPVQPINLYIHSKKLQFTLSSCNCLYICVLILLYFISMLVLCTISLRYPNLLITINLSSNRYYSFMLFHICLTTCYCKCHLFYAISLFASYLSYDYFHHYLHLVQ
jgi:hypothetical protein